MKNVFTGILLTSMGFGIVSCSSTSAPPEARLVRYCARSQQCRGQYTSAQTGAGTCNQDRLADSRGDSIGSTFGWLLELGQKFRRRQYSKPVLLHLSLLTAQRYWEGAQNFMAALSPQKVRVG